jgi:predicted CXXCH cytochrome family protein
MKIRISLVVVTVALVGLGFGTNAYAFHSGGVAECGGCHNMHNAPPGGSFLLVGTDQSSACLTCHENSADTGPTSYHVSTAPGSLGAGQAPLQRSPGGDFGWLKKSYTFVVRGSTISEEGQTHGHNIVAADFTYVADTENTQAPGGNFAAGDLHCTSCHDPHGKYRRLSDGSIATAGAPIIGSGSYATSANPASGEAVGVYRLLAGIGYKGIFTTNPPAAVAPSTYNRTESTTQTRVAYGKNMSEWCATCHEDMHSAGNYVHPVSQNLGSTIAGIYGQYKKSGDMSGVATSSYLSLVPFEENSTDYATVLKPHAKNDDTYLQGPTTTSQVSCMSCHRAHASGFEYALRWNMEGEFMTYQGNWPGTDTTPTVPQFARGRTGAETQAAYYDRAATTFASYQRVLCNKCHAQD